MSWICNICATSNPDDADVCFVCDAEKPLEIGGVVSVCTLTVKRAEALPPLIDGELIVPSEYNEIGEEAFQGRTDIRTVRLHAGVRKIRKSAFEGCVNLQTITSYGTLKHIGVRAFANCTSLTERPTAKYVAEDAFQVDRMERTETLDRSSFSGFPSASSSSTRSETLSGRVSFSSDSAPSTTPTETASSTSTTSTTVSASSTSTTSSTASVSVPTTPRGVVRVKLFFGIIGLILGCLLVTALAIVTFCFVFGREWEWNQLQWLIGGVGGFVLFTLLLGWILSITDCGFAKTGNLFGLFVIGIASIGNFIARISFQGQYKIMFVWAAAYAVCATVLLSFFRKGKGWKVAHYIEGGLILASLAMGLFI